MRRFFTFTLFLLACAFFPLFANVAMPGIYSAGGTSGFRLLFPQDSLAFARVEMQQEKVVVQLYPGYAIVKGTYWMFNPEADSLHLHLGYPVNGVYESESSYDRFEIVFDELYAIEAYANDQPVHLYQESGLDMALADNWYIWDQVFAPQALTKLEVFFIVNTNDASILQGYNRDQHNAFLYLLESGRSWKGTIGEGEVLIQLMDGLKLDNIWGGMPDSAFGYDAAQNILRYQFSDWEPADGENVGLVYGERLENFDFAAVAERSEALFAQIEAFSETDSKSLNLSPIVLGDIFEVHSFDYFSWTLGAILIGVPLLLFVLVFFVVRWWWLRKGKKKAAQQP